MKGSKYTGKNRVRSWHKRELDFYEAQSLTLHESLRATLNGFRWVYKGWWGGGGELF